MIQADIRLRVNKKRKKNNFKHCIKFTANAFIITEIKKFYERKKWILVIW